MDIGKPYKIRVGFTDGADGNLSWPLEKVGTFSY